MFSFFMVTSAGTNAAAITIIMVMYMPTDTYQGNFGISVYIISVPNSPDSKNA